MLKLTNVTKTYVSKKSKQKVDALRGVSFELADTGMVFILGKSGSGKSTLLNMLGGLDSPTTGEIVVDGVSMKDFKQADYEGYRNGYVGFIFQEFNLLNEFNVKDNIALALHLSKGDNIDERVLKALQQVELSEEYLTRRVDEMSGGEKQRVAIARTIVKDSKMILADEPTGNLDEATGESIWNILKELSKTRLVVVVSHDRDSATKYGDRVIEIADGSVIADSGKQDVINEVKEKFTSKKRRLSFVTCLKMGVNSLFQHKVRSTCVLVLSILTLLALIITQLCLSYSTPLTVAKFIKKNDIDYIVIKGDRITRNEDRAFLDENATYIKYQRGSCNATVNGKQDILNMGFSFVGEAMELDKDSFYITNKALKDRDDYLDKTQNNNYKSDYYLDDNGDKVYFDKSPSSWEDFIGKRVQISRLGNEVPPILAGIVDVSNASEFELDYLPETFVTEDFLTDYYYVFNRLVLSEKDGIVDIGGDKQYSGPMTIDSSTTSVWLPKTDIYVTGSGMVNYREFTLGDGEIVITYEMLQAFFDVKDRFDYVEETTKNNYTLLEIPEQIGKTYPFVIYDEQGELVANLGELKIVAVGFNLHDGADVVACVNKATSWDLYSQTCKEYLVKLSSVSNIRSFITDLSQNHCINVIRAGTIHYLYSNSEKDCVEFAEMFGRHIGSFTLIIGLISAILTLVLLALATNLIALSITGRKRDIGILSALGTSNKDIAKIFVIETLVIATITFIVVLIASFICGAVFNHHFAYSYVKIDHLMSFFNVDLPTVGILIAATFGLHLLATMLPLSKISKLKPIDAIRNN